MYNHKQPGQQNLKVPWHQPISNIILVHDRAFELLIHLPWSQQRLRLWGNEDCHIDELPSLKDMRYVFI